MREDYDNATVEGKGQLVRRNKPPGVGGGIHEGQHKIGRPGSEMDSTLIYMDQAEKHG